MSTPIVVAGANEEEALKEVLDRYHLPREAVDYEVMHEEDEMLLPGAKPQLQLQIHIRPEYIGECALDHLANILDIMEIEAEVSFDIEDEIIFVRVASPTAASLLIGRDGQNLEALQYLISRMAMRVGREAPMLVIDIENYRQRQFDKLKDLAERAYKAAIESGNEIELDPMPSLERKYVHHYLRHYKDIRTFSRGDEPERSLVIIAI